MALVKMRILNCLHRSHFGGAQQRIVWVDGILDPRGIKTLILFPQDEEKEYEAYLENRKLPFIRLRFPYLRNLRHVFNNVWFLLSLSWYVLSFKRIIKKENVDIVHVNGVTNLQPLVAALLSGRPVIWHFNDMLTPGIFVKWVSVFFKCRKVFPVAATAEIIKHYALEHKPVNAWRILPAPLPRMNPPDREPQRLSELKGLGREARFVGFIGNLVPLKGAMDFVRVAERLLEKDEHLHAVIVGAEFHSQKDYALAVKEYAGKTSGSGRFHFVGYQSNVWAWLKLFDVLVFPSHSEACPILVLEAMDVGVPMVVTRVGDVPHMIGDIDIPIVEPHDIDGLVSGAESMLGEAVNKGKLAGQLQERVRENYSLERVAELHAEIYETALRNS